MEHQKGTIKKSINDLIRMTAIIAFGAFQEKYKQPKFLENSAEDSLYLKLMHMIDEGKINEAENLLIERLESKKLEDLQLALDIYNYMNEKSDEFLQSNNFERIEIEEGVKSVIIQFGYNVLA